VQGGLFSRIIDLTTPIPNGTGTFTNVMASSFSGSTISFYGGGTGGQVGIYTATLGSVVTRIADRNTPVPGGTGNFFPTGTLLPSHWISNNVVVFNNPSSSSTSESSGVYTAPAGGGSITRIADTNTVMPGGTGETFSSVGRTQTAISSSNLAFIGRN